MEDPTLKRIIKQAGLALLCAFLLMGAAQAATITPSVTKVTLSENQTTFTVDVSMAQEEAFAGAEFGVDLPEGVTVTGVTFLDEAIQNASKSPQIVKDGRYFFGFYDTKNSFSGSYAVARLTFSYAGKEDVTIALDYSKVVTVLGTGSTSGDTTSSPFTVQVTRKEATQGGGSGTGGGTVIPGGDVDIDDPDTPLTELPFVDVAADAWYAQAVAYVNEAGLMTGTGSTTFSPDIHTTRAMVATILYRIAGSPALEDENLGYPYADVVADSWYGPAVYWARLHQVVNGVGNNLFDPHSPVTREQLVTMLYRYAGQPAVTGDTSAFTDSDDVSDWAADAMAWAIESGIIAGMGNNTLAPQGFATRAQVATILMRYLAAMG